MHYFNKVCLLCFVLLILATSASARIVFGSVRDGVDGIYVMDDDGSNLRLLTDKFRPILPRWSPDGKHIAFRAYGPDGSYLYLMNSDGTNGRQITKEPIDYIGAISFSPDGASLVFDMHVEIGNTVKKSIKVVNIKTGKVTELVDLDAADLDAIYCDWSPDGKHIVFSRSMRVNMPVAPIHIMRADGHKPHPLLDPIKGRQRAPRWSPDGKQIVYLQDKYTWTPIGNGRLALIYHAHQYMICDRNGKNIKQLQIPKDWRPISIDWMDDGESVVFSAYAGLPLDEPILEGFEFPPQNIYKHHIWTEVTTQLTNHPGDDDIIDWISDDVLSVTPIGKKKVTLGTIKKMDSQ